MSKHKKRKSKKRYLLIRNYRISINRFNRAQDYKYWKKDKRRKRVGKTRDVIAFENTTYDHDIIKAPTNFSFIEEPVNTISFINLLYSRQEVRKKVYVDILHLESLDYSAITVLLSVMISFKANRVKFNGNLPVDPDLRELLINSGFFKSLNRPFGNRTEYIIGKPNQIFTNAKLDVNSDLALQLTKEATKTIWGEYKTCKGLQRVLVELMHNTNNHANRLGKGKQHWWLSVNHNTKLKKVTFIFVDYGIGIFESLQNISNQSRWYTYQNNVLNFIRSRTRKDVLKDLMNGDLHLTVTGHKYRGKGLPGIKEVCDKNEISNLHVISNNVFGNISKTTYNDLKVNFHGTFVSWELSQENVSMPWVL